MQQDIRKCGTALELKMTCMAQVTYAKCKVIQLCTYHFGIMRIPWFSILKQRLKLIVLCESYDLQDCPKLGKNLNKIQPVKLQYFAYKSFTCNLTWTSKIINANC